ncbi:hypothetical protein [Maribacter sp. IgM3_T14_3]
MNPKTKSLLYFTSFVIAVLSYYNIENSNIQNTEIALHTQAQVSTQEALN